MSASHFRLQWCSTGPYLFDCHRANGIAPVDGCCHCKMLNRPPKTPEPGRPALMGTEYTGRPDWHIGGDGSLNTPTYSTRVDEICGIRGAAKPTELAKYNGAWNPRKVLRAVFGGGKAKDTNTLAYGNAKAAFDACDKWARGNPETLREAVSAACQWAIEYHHGPKYIDKDPARPNPAYKQPRHGQSVSLKPGNFVRESLSNALREAARNAGPDRWIYGSVGDHCTECDGRGSADNIPCDFCEGTGRLRRRKWIHAYHVELPDDFGSDDDDGGESRNELNDPKYRPPDYSGPGEEDPDALMREQLAALIDPYLATQAQGKARAFRAIYMSQETETDGREPDLNSLRELAKELGVSHETVRRWADEIFGTLSGLFST